MAIINRSNTLPGDWIMIKKKAVLTSALIFFCIINLLSCAAEFGNVLITKPDEYRHVYEANEKIILKAIAKVFREKSLGTRVTIDDKKNMVDTDYFIQGDWRTKGIASVKRLNWKECEVTLIVITEKKTQQGWEMRRLLEKEQYVSFFNVIDLKIYEEMAKIE
jgi:hypothetical protein